MNLKEGKWLVLDTAMPKWFVCFLCNAKCVYFHDDTKPVLEHLFDHLKNGFLETGITTKDLDGFIFCEGPGSALSIRTVCLFLRTLAALPSYENIKLFAYNAMHWGQRLLIAKASYPFHVIAYAGLKDAYVLNVSNPKTFSTITKISRKDLKVDEPNTYWLPHMCKEGMEYTFNLETFLDTPEDFFKRTISPNLFHLG